MDVVGLVLGVLAVLLVIAPSVFGAASGCRSGPGGIVRGFDVLIFVVSNPPYVRRI